ncbi:hypothetical protein B0T10DRAFT_464699 [Thelonectria olida]|uniref:Uncharacterized protein n=1 Tax=Thelonectria olida TaxID=1576542 RepID=A0A9P8VXH2_9HYPO|nr:hypothetical protein B0T10DRAFT_464699 [Thelonectria olida]
MLKLVIASFLPIRSLLLQTRTSSKRPNACLLPLKEETKRFESRQPGFIGWIMQSLFRLIDHFKAETNEPSPESSLGLRRPQRNIAQPRRYDDSLELTEETKFLRQSCRFALHRLEHYMLLLDQTPVYWAATILHPGLMMRWVHLAMPSKAELIEQRVESFFIEALRWTNDWVEFLQNEFDWKDDAWLHDWNHLTVAEVYMFIAALICMGRHIESKVRAY